MSVSPALAQTGASSGQDTPRQHQRQGDEKRQGVQPRAQDQRNERETKELEGTVRKVDEESQALRVSNGMLGLGDTTLQVTDQTRIRVEGGTGSLWVNGERVAEREIAQPFLVAWEGLDVGRDTGSPVSPAYAAESPFAFAGRLTRVVYDLR